MLRQFYSDEPDGIQEHSGVLAGTILQVSTITSLT
jgi:hypothetical protein